MAIVKEMVVEMVSEDRRPADRRSRCMDGLREYPNRLGARRNWRETSEDRREWSASTVPSRGK